MRPESVRLDHAAPVRIERCGPLWSNAFTPMVFVGEAAARPANVWDSYRFERSDDVIADTARVRDLGIRPDPDAFINTMAQMFGKLAEEIAIDLRARPGCVDC